MDDKNLNYLSPTYKEGREKIEAIENILYKVNKYIRSPEELSDNFVDYIDIAITNILQHSNISGQKGDELASDLIFRCAKLFMNFTHFEKYYNHEFFITKKKDDSIIKTTHKGLTYEDYNKFFGSDFIKSPSIEEFKDGQIVQIYAEKKELEGKICKKAWVIGKINGIDNDTYNGIYSVVYYKSDNKNSKCNIKFPKLSLEIEKKGGRTDYLDNKFKLYMENETTFVDYCLEINVII